MTLKFNTPKSVIDKIRGYYKHCSLYLPENSKFRYFKFRLPNGNFKTFSIRNKEQLRKLLIQFTPIDVYYSSSQFINPKRVQGRLTKKQDLLFLSQDIIIDIDAEENQPFMDIVKISKRIVKLFGIPNYILRTSDKGIQIAYKDDMKGINKLSIEDRMKLYEQKRKEFVQLFDGIDKPITTDLYRVVRLPKTIHHNGTVCDFIDLDNIPKFKYVFTDNIIVSKSQKAMTQGESSQPQNTGNKSRVDIRDIASNDYLSNNILGTKGLYVPLLIYHYPQITKLEPANPIQEIKCIMKKYDIPTMYLLKDNEYLYAISLIAVDGRRLQKIINYSNSLICKKMFKYKQIFMKISPSLDKQDFLRPYGILSYTTYKKRYYLSKSHLAFILSFNFPIKNKGVFIGKSNARVVTTWKK